MEDYNHYMMGVNMADQMMQYYHLGCRSFKWTRKMLIHFFNMAVFNAYVLHKSRMQETMLQCKFRMILASQLLCKGLAKVGQNEDGCSDAVEVKNVEGHWPELLPPTVKRPKPYRACKECAHKKKNNTPYCCAVCMVLLHPQCFKSYHDKLEDSHLNNVTDTYEEDGTLDFDFDN